MLVYSRKEPVHIGYKDSDFKSYLDSKRSTLGFVFTLGGGAIIWKSIKKSCIANSTLEAEYIAACKAAKEVV